MTVYVFVKWGSVIVCETKFVLAGRRAPVSDKHPGVPNSNNYVCLGSARAGQLRDFFTRWSYGILGEKAFGPRCYGGVHAVCRGSAIRASYLGGVRFLGGR